MEQDKKEEMKLINMIYRVEKRKEVPMVKVKDGERVPDDPMVKVKDGEGVPDEPMVEENEVDRLNNSIKLYIDNVVKYEKKNGLDYQDNNGNTALIVAVQTGNEFVANALIYAGADVTIKNIDKKTALFYAIRMNMPDIYKRLKEKEKLKSGGKKRKTKKGKRGNKSKESRKGKKSRKERKSRKGKKV